MCYATLTAQIPQIFCEQAEKEEVCRREPAFSYWSGILSPALFDKQNNHFYPLFHFGMIRVEKTWNMTDCQTKDKDIDIIKDNYNAIR